MEKPQKPAEVKGGKKPSENHVFILTALVGTITALIIGIVSLTRRRPSPIPGKSVAHSTDGQDRVLPDSYRSATEAGIGWTSQSEAPIRPGQNTTRISVGSSEAPGIIKMPATDDDLNQGQEGQLTSGFQNPSTRWSRPTKYVVGVGLFIAMVFVVYISRSSLSMIIFAALLAFVVNPSVKLLSESA